MKTRVGLILAAALLPIGCGGGTTPEATAPPSTVEPPRIVAEVNGAPILARQVDELVETERARMVARGEQTSPEALRDLRRNALQLLIGGELVFQAAQASGIQVEQDAIDEQIRIARSQFASDEEFEAYLSGAGLTLERLEEEAQRRALMQAYASSVAPGLDAGLEAAALKIYEERKQEFRESDEVHAARIIVRFLPGDPPERREAALTKIREAKRRLDAGEDFASVARAYSESPFADRGGDMGWFGRGRTLPEFEDVVFATPVGATSDIFETRHGFNIVQVLERREGRPRSFDEIRTGLLMVLVREQGDQNLKDHVAELRAAADVRILDEELR